jgi:DNA-binding transcriptional LysR family regulator
LLPTLKQLEALYWVAELGGFKPAAGRLHITQSTLSKRIVELEALIGKPLLYESYRKSRLTPAGLRVVQTAGDMLALAGQLMGPLKDEALAGVVRLGTTELVALTWLASMIERLKSLHPLLKLDLEVDVGTRLVRKVESNQMDIAFVPGPVHGRKLAETELGKAEFVLAVGRSFKIPRRAVRPDELSALPMLMHHSEAISTRMFERWLDRIGATPPSVITANSMSVMAQLTASGIGVSRLPTGLFRKEFARGALRKLRCTEVLPAQPYVAIHRSDADDILIAKVLQVARKMCRFDDAKSAVRPSR